MEDGAERQAGPFGPLACGDGSRPVAFDANGVVTLARFLAQVRGVAACLPDAGHAVNLCEDRYRFLVAFCAAASRGQTTLLPSSRAPASVDDALCDHADGYCLGDREFALPPRGYRPLPDPLPERDGGIPKVEDSALAAIGFTSGSTGRPGRNPKTWGAFRAGTAQNLAALSDLWPAGETPWIVATVPPQHMYGMELSVLLPLLGGAAVHAGRPLFPADVARALRDAAGPRLLVTTPVHLRALVEGGADLPPMAGIVSATAPLSPELAAAAEARFGCEVRELFGSTETCVIARRRTARDAAWTPLPGVRVAACEDGAWIEAGHLPGPVRVADRVDVRKDGGFVLRGRAADLLEIAGKRASLGDLTARLLAIPGVEDGVVFQLDGEGVRRIAALVVAPGLDEAAILAGLRGAVDPVFLPRRLRRVEALPRNDTGKLPRAALLDLLHAPISA
ncbi:xanthomonadin biosynthesis 3-hydroxybenozate--AMP ligase XanA2 [Luteimonas pelagia]